jgi:hypothetical protein
LVVGFIIGSAVTALLEKRRIKRVGKEDRGR